MLCTKEGDAGEEEEQGKMMVQEFNNMLKECVYVHFYLQMSAKSIK